VDRQERVINKYSTLINEFSDLLITEDELRLKKGMWGSSVCLDIGCGNGELISNLAVKNPNKFFIGFELQYKEIYRTQLKIKRTGCLNAKISSRINAQNIPNFFEVNEIGDVYIFFPDPWLKRKQKKKRLVNFEYMRKLVPLIKTGSFITLKTDSDDYFMQMLNVCYSLKQELGLELLDLSRDFHSTSNTKNYPITSFERLFIIQKLSVNYLKMRKL